VAGAAALYFNPDALLLTGNRCVANRADFILPAQQTNASGAAPERSLLGAGQVVRVGWSGGAGATIQQAHGVPLAWLEIMQVVAGTESHVLDIAKALSITVGGTSKVVDKGKAAGLCQRKPDPTDGRSNLIQLTEQAKSNLDTELHRLREIGATADGAMGHPDPMKAIEKDPSPNGDSTSSSSQRCRRVSLGGSPGTSHIVSEPEPMFHRR
jgi:hypothetical protein